MPDRSTESIGSVAADDAALSTSLSFTRTMPVCDETQRGRRAVAIELLRIPAAVNEAANKPLFI